MNSENDLIQSRHISQHWIAFFLVYSIYRNNEQRNDEIQRKMIKTEQNSVASNINIDWNHASLSISWSKLSNYMTGNFGQRDLDRQNHLFQTQSIRCDRKKKQLNLQQQCYRCIMCIIRRVIFVFICDQI